MSDTLRHSNTETCFSVLINAIKQGNVDSFAVALLDMKQLVSRSTSPLLFWREDVFNGIMCLDREDDRLEKMKEFFRQCPEIKKSECNINFFGKAIGRRAPECIEFFLDEGVAPSFGRHELEDMIVPMACGMWMHIDRLHPTFFQDPAFRMGLANSLASYMFDPAIYSKGWGFFRPDMMDHLARMNNSEYITHVMLIALPKAHIVHPDTDAALTVSHPWAEGIMRAVENELLTWPEIEGMTNDQPSRANYIGQVRSECERIKLQSQTHQAASVSKSGPRL